MNLNPLKDDSFAARCIKSYENIFLYGVGTVVAISLGLAFYNVWWSGVVFAPFAIYIVNMLKKGIVDKRRQKEKLVLADGLELMLMSLEAGISDENAYINTGERLVQSNPKSIVAQMWSELSIRLSRNETLDDVLYLLAKDTGIEEITELREVYVIAKRSGGNLVEIIETLIERLLERLEVSRELQVLVSGKRFEERIMCLMPFMMIIYLRSSGDFIGALYGNVQGIIIMSVCAGIYMIAFMRAEKIVDIQ